MKIKLKKEGGFMGMTNNASIDLDKIPDDERNALSDLISNPPNLKSEDIEDEDDSNQRGLGMPMNDTFSYELKVRKGPKYVTLKFNDKNIPEKLYTIFQKYITDIPSI
jgi:hypothetical protein